MSIVRKCDRCGGYFEGRLFEIEIREPVDLDGVHYDLCGDCVLEFDKFMSGTKPESLLTRILPAKED